MKTLRKICTFRKKKKNIWYNLAEIVQAASPRDASRNIPKCKDSLSKEIALNETCLVLHSMKETQLLGLADFKSSLENITGYTEMKVSNLLAVHLTVLSISAIFKAQRECLQEIFTKVEQTSSTLNK